MKAAQQPRPKTLGVFVDTFLPSSETFVYNQIRSLERWRPAVLCRSRANENRFPISATTIHAPPSFFSRLKHVDRGVAVRARDSLYDAHGLTWLLRARVDLLLAHFGPSGMAMKRLARVSRTPLVVIFHGYDATEALQGRSFEAAYPGLIGSARLFIAVSDFIAGCMIRAGVPASMVATHYLGIPLPHPPAPRTFGGRLLQVGRLTEKKGHETALKALAAARRENPDLNMRIVGDGPLRDHLLECARNLGVSEAVTFLGDLHPAEIQAEMEAADIYVHPSRTTTSGDCEGLPISILEAMSNGLPVISTRHAGIPEAVDGSTGLLVDESDSAALAQAIHRLTADRHLRESLGAGARARAEQQFDIASNTVRFERLLSGVPSRSWSRH